MDLSSKFCGIIFFSFILLPCFIQCRDKNEILSWKPPKNFKKWYPYFLAGYDKTNAPVIVLEFGRWDIKATTDMTPKHVKDLTKYTEQFMVRAHESPRLYKHPNGTSTPDKWVGIVDLDGFDEPQFGHLPTVMKMVDMARQFATSETNDRRFKKIYLVNANYLFKTAYNVIRPALGATAVDVEVYGTITEKWKPVLLQEIPQDQLPIWLGGTSEDYKPLAVFG